MNIIDALNQGIEISLKNTKELMQNKDFEKLLKMFDKFLSAASSKNYSRLLNINLYDFFSMIVIARNYDMYNYSIDEISKSLEPYRNLINSWQTKYNLTNIANIVVGEEKDEHFDETPDYKVLLKSLGLGSELSKYNLMSAFKTTEVLIHFRILYTTQAKDLTIEYAIRQVKEGIENIVLFCRSYRNEIINDKKEYMDFYRQRVKCTEQLRESIKTESITKLMNVSDDWYEYLHPTILSLVYPIVNMNLERYYTYLNLMIEKMEEDVNRTPLIKFIYEQHLSPDSIPEEIHEKLNKINIETISTNYTLLKYLGFEPYQIFLKHSDLLININQDDASKLTYLVEKDIINRYTIQNKPYILLDQIPKIMCNYEILKELVDFNNINYNGNILLEDPNIIKNRLRLLSNYQLLKSNFIFLLCHIVYLPVYDLIIENEIPEYLLTTICETKNPLLTIKRIKMYKELSIPYLSEANSLLREIYDSSKSLCSEEELDEMYPDTITNNIYNSINGTTIGDIKEDDLVKELDEQYRLDDTYLITSKPISRPKVLRNLQYIKDHNGNPKEYLLLAMISNSIINDQEINEFKEKNYSLLN